MKLLYHAIFALGEGCNTLLISANFSKAHFDTLRSCIDMPQDLSSAVTNHAYIMSPCMCEANSTHACTLSQVKLDSIPVNDMSTRLLVKKVACMQLSTFVTIQGAVTPISAILTAVTGVTICDRLNLVVTL